MAKKKVNKTTYLVVRMTPEERVSMQKMAHKIGLPVSKYLFRMHTLFMEAIIGKAK